MADDGLIPTSRSHVVLSDWSIPALGSHYRSATLAAMPLDAWRQIVEQTLQIMAGKITYFQLLGEVEAARSRAFHGIDSPCIPPEAQASVTLSSMEPTYWSIVLEVITASRWGAIIEVAREQAMVGDPKARSWLSNVLGAGDAIREIARVHENDTVPRADIFDAVDDDEAIQGAGME